MEVGVFKNLISWHGDKCIGKVVSKMANEIERLQAEIARLREELKWYDDEIHYPLGNDGTSEIEIDRGRRARVGRGKA